jgi:tetratricopeptide (TPR) repeat protein
MTQGIIKILYDKPYKPAKPRIFSTLYDVIKDQGIDAGIEEYHQLTKQGLKLREGDINYFGYELIKVDLIDAAISFFKLNVEKHPNSSNVYDSLAEAYVMNKKPKLALTNFEKALALDPKKVNAQEAIKKLKAAI